MNELTLLKWIVIVVLVLLKFSVMGEEVQTKVSGQTTQTCMDSSDFAQVVKTSYYVDKTLFIKDIFLSAKVNMVAAPRKFGKSTNLNMIKRFLEIEMDTNGQPMNITSTSNYKVFVENHLQITKDERFFNQHFGKHPVIYINFSSLKTVDSYKDLLKEFRKIVTKTFAYHTYLVKNASIWKSEAEKETFVKYIIRPKSKELKLEDLPFVFKWLTQLLHNRFGRKPVVLIDECDAFVYPLIFKSAKDLGRVSRFMMKTEESLLVSNEHIDRGLMTGVLNTYRGDLADDIYDYHFLEDYQFSLYYGLTEDDLAILLKRLVPDDVKRSQLKKTIDEFYGGYKIYNKNCTLTNSHTNIYCIWSVIYFLTHHHYMINYLCPPEYYDQFQNIFKNDEVKSVVKSLLEGKQTHLDLREPFYKEDILELNNLVKNINTTGEFRRSTVPHLLYNFGYLTPVVDNNGFSIGRYKLANKETLCELEKYISA
ncbi:uncharacterized protein LOC128982848 [Macrosteles quadrilineatus]|uniref:uncharacterized protein LOC128982848 n=1 Tax=Macrosteles quadrilineatus TaxID=74068 RepID=UPI0023E0985A|nr:uncharacterized protein LOC128982848 [Macrosteles quadrilineatus]